MYSLFQTASAPCHSVLCFVSVPDVRKHCLATGVGMAWILPELAHLQQTWREQRLDTPERTLFFSPRANKNASLARQVQAEWETWRPVVTEQEHQEREISKGGDDAETLAGLFISLLSTALTKRQVYYRYARRYFHYDVGLEGFVGSIPERARTPAGEQTLRNAWQAFFYHSSIIWAGLRPVVEGQAAGLEAAIILARAIELMSRAMREIPPQLVGALTESSHDTVREAATMQLAGWAATQVSLKNPRLQATLATEDQRALITLFEWLPSRVLFAWKDRHPLETLTTLTKCIQQYVLEDRLHAPSRNTRRIDFDDVPSLEDMWVREEIRRASNLDALTARANLAPQEAAIWGMVRHNLPYTEVAARLKIAEGTVKAAMSRVREKLRKAADT